jgi:cobalamin biosynthesis Mg chelatase CobN
MAENTKTLNSEEAIQDFLDILEKHRIQCEKEGKFQEAELAKQRLIELRTQETQRKRDNLRSKQLSERLEVEEAHLLEFNQFNQQWDSRQQQYFEHAQELESKMAEKHQQELEEFRERNEA